MLENRWKRAGMVVVLVSCLVSVGWSAAYFSVNTRADNVITFGSVKIKLHQYSVADDGELLELKGQAGTENILRNSKVKRVVRVENVGHSPAYVRFRLVPQGASEQGHAAAKHFLPKMKVDSMMQVEAEPGRWVQKDGWFYYPDVLEPGEISDEAGVKLNFDVDKITKDYKEYVFTLDIEAHAVQSENNEDGTFMTAYGAEVDDVIEIGTALELLGKMEESAAGETFQGKTLRLTADIDFSQPIKSETGTAYEDAYAYMAERMASLKTATFNRVSDSPFRGTFDGDGHTIKGLKYDISGDDSSSMSDTGLFGFTEGATIKNLAIDGAVIDADYRGGIVAGYAQDTTFENISIKNSTLTMYCYNVVLTLGADGGLTGGALTGQANNCYVYNCETVSCVVKSNMTSGVEAASGKGLFLGGLIGDLKGGRLEYSRVCGEKSLVSLYYDVAVGALGGVTGYVGGLIGEMQNGAKVIDCFSTAELYSYTATYVSIGAGNSGKIGGIAAAVQGDRTEIHRCHYAGKASSKQYNAILVIPIIQKNKNISGLVEDYSGDTYNVWDSYFKYQLNEDVDMGTLGDDTATSEFGPKDNDTYRDQVFWESHDYDFYGNILRGDDGHVNKWVMDYDLGIPVHRSTGYVTIHIAESDEGLGEGSGETSGETFIFNITSSSNSAEIIKRIPVTAGGSTMVELPFGYYIAAEDEAWAWRYEGNMSDFSLSSQNPEKDIFFEHRKDESINPWVGSFARAKNIFLGNTTI